VTDPYVSHAPGISWITEDYPRKVDQIPTDGQQIVIRSPDISSRVLAEEDRTAVICWNTTLSASSNASWITQLTSNASKEFLIVIFYRNGHTAANLTDFRAGHYARRSII